MIEGEELGKMMDHYPGILKHSDNFRDFPDNGAPGDVEEKRRILGISRTTENSRSAGADGGLTAKGRRVDGELPES